MSLFLCFCCSESLAGGEDLIYALVRTTFDQQSSKRGSSTLNKELSHGQGRDWCVGGDGAVCVFGFPGVPAKGLVLQKEGDVCNEPRLR